MNNSSFGSNARRATASTSTEATVGSVRRACKKAAHSPAGNGACRRTTWDRPAVGWLYSNGRPSERVS